MKKMSEVDIPSTDNRFSNDISSFIQKRTWLE